MSQALIVIDVQNDFCSGGALAVSEGNQIVPLINAMMPDFDAVILTQDWHPADHCSFAANHPGKPLFSLQQIPTGPDGSGQTMEQVMWPTHCVQGTWGAEFAPGLTVQDTDLVQPKGTDCNVDSYSGFFDNCQNADTGLQNRLRALGVNAVFCAGVAYDYCVGSTAADAAKCAFYSYTRPS